MIPLTPLQLDVLDCASDDYENLEQIYRSLAFEFSSEKYTAGAESFYWREKSPPVFLADIADAVLALARAGLFRARIEDGPFRENLTDPSFVWRDWFCLSDQGRRALATHGT